MPAYIVIYLLGSIFIFFAFICYFAEYKVCRISTLLFFITMITTSWIGVFAIGMLYVCDVISEDNDKILFDFRRKEK